MRDVQCRGSHYVSLPRVPTSPGAISRFEIQGCRAWDQMGTRGRRPTRIHDTCMLTPKDCETLFHHVPRPRPGSGSLHDLLCSLLVLYQDNDVVEQLLPALVSDLWPTPRLERNSSSFYKTHAFNSIRIKSRRLVDHEHEGHIPLRTLSLKGKLHIGQKANHMIRPRLLI